jgi:enoyl-[acyl-carrier protein] reductase I
MLVAQGRLAFDVCQGGTVWALPMRKLRHCRLFKPTTYCEYTMGFLTGKKLLITGVLSNRSIAYGIAKACHREGAELAFSYVGERFKDRITEFAADFDSKLIFDCDVGSDEQIARMFADLSQTWPTFDGFVHAIGFAPREAIAGDFLEGLSREGYKIAHDISAYSFPAMAKACLPMLNDKSSVLTLTYLGAERVVPNYNTMGLAKASLEASVRYLAESLGAKNRGLRANGISAGPIKTLAASGIKGFGKILSVVAENSPIRRNVTIDDVGNVAAFLLSDLAAGVSAEITYVDGGFSNVVGGIAEPAAS